MFYIFWAKGNSAQSIKKYTVFAQYHFPSSKNGNLRSFCNPVYTGFLFTKDWVSLEAKSQAPTGI